MNINPELIAIAEWRLSQQRNEWEAEKQAAEKFAFIPPGGGGPPGGPPPGGDPSAGAAGGGGAPPGVGDPSAGGMSPMDPSMAGGGAPPVPGGGGMNADTISQIVAQTMQQMGGMGGGGAGVGGGGAGGKMVKPDIATVAIDIFQVKKMLQYMFNTMGIPLPPDILDGPNRDPSTGTPMPPGAPGSTSDPSTVSQQAPGGAAGGAGGDQAGGSIPPIQPVQPGGPGVGGPTPGGMPPGVGSEKQSQDRILHIGNGHYEPSFDPKLISRAAALSALIRRIGNE
jgi:hypothetical protein